MTGIVHPAYRVIQRTESAWAGGVQQAAERARIILRDLVTAGWLEAELLTDEATPPFAPHKAAL